MNVYYKRLDADDRKYVKQVRDSYKRMCYDYGILDDRTVEECIAHVLCSHEDKLTRINTMIDAEIKEELKKSSKVTRSRNNGKNNPYVLRIYNGLATTLLTKAEGEDAIVTKNESIELIGGKNRIRWQDIVNMSAIYCTIGRNEEFATNDEIEINAEDVYRTICAGYYYDETIKDFSDSLNETVNRFEALGGTYTVDGKKRDIGSDTFFSGLKTFDDNGNASFIKSSYQKLCEQQDRIIKIDPEYVHCNSLDESYVHSYLVYRHKFSRNQKRVISYNTIRRVLGKYPTGDFSYDNMAFSVRRWLNELKPLFKGRKIGRDNISWKENNNED